MNGYLLADLILQHAFNAFAAFFLFYMITEGAIRLFQISNFRLRALLKLVPPLRLLLQPLFALLPFHLLPLNISIFSCSHPLQYYLFNSLSDASKEELLHYGIKTVTGKALLWIPESLLLLLIGAGVLFSFLRLARLVRDVALSLHWIAQVRKNAEPMEPSHLGNERLATALEAHGVAIIVTQESVGPLAGAGKCIVIPEILVTRLSKEEFGAVIAHELEHHRWFDIGAKLLCQGVAAIFWWIPMKGACRAMELEQELACDAAIHSYSVESESLAVALRKTAQYQMEKPLALCASFATGKQALFKRVEAVLDPVIGAKQGVQAKFRLAFVFAGTLTPLLHFATC